MVVQLDDHSLTSLKSVLMLTPDINFIAIIVAAIVPNALGALYYGPIAGNAWLASIGKTREQVEPSNPALVYGGSLLLSFLAAFAIFFTTQMIHKDVNAAGELYFASHQTFGHGALHGAALFGTLVMPVVISLGLFHKSSGKSILINVVFWTICFMIMGGITDVWR